MGELTLERCLLQCTAVLGGEPDGIHILAWCLPGMVDSWREERQSPEESLWLIWTLSMLRGRWKKLIAWFELFYEGLSRLTISFMYFNINIQVFYSRTMINCLLLKKEKIGDNGSQLFWLNLYNSLWFEISHSKENTMNVHVCEAVHLLKWGWEFY